MRQRIAPFLIALSLLLALTGCAAGNYTPAADMAYGGEAAKVSLYEPEEYALNDYASVTSRSEAAPAAMEPQSRPAEEPNSHSTGSLPTTDKIIYTAHAEVETQNFDTTIKDVYAMIDHYGGFLENSSVTGNNYYSGSRYGRTASFTIRIPRDSFEDMTGSLAALGNVPYFSTNAENITAQYTDTSSRLKSYRIQEERLLTMLEKADTIEDMLNIESRLADLRYSIENLTSTLLGWDSLISYSTVNLRVEEVAIYTEDEPVVRSYWEQVGDTFRGTLDNIATFFKYLLMFVVGASPVLVILAVIIIAVLLLVRRARKKRKAVTPPTPPAPPAPPAPPSPPDDKGQQR